MSKQIKILFFLKLISLGWFAISMEKGFEEPIPLEGEQKSHFEKIQIELRNNVLTIAWAQNVKEIIKDSQDIFDAYHKIYTSNILHNKTSKSDFFQGTIFADSDEALEMRKAIASQVINEKFENPFIDNTVEENNKILNELFSFATREMSPENELEAAQIILTEPNVNLKVGANPVNPILIEAVKMGYKKLVRLLLELGADANIQDKQKFTALSFAIRQDPELVQILLEFGANPNALDENGKTPLTWAVFYNKINSVVLLMAAGADANIKDVDGDTPIKMAKRLKFKEIKKLLKKSSFEKLLEQYYKLINRSRKFFNEKSEKESEN